MMLQIIGIVSTSGIFAGLIWMGKMSHRLDAVEDDIKDLRAELRTGLADLNKRIDSLMLAITRSAPR